MTNKSKYRMFVIATFAYVHKIPFEIALEYLGRALIKYDKNRIDKK